MATLQELYSYEGQIEPALVEILVARGLNAFPEFSDADKETPYTDVSIVHVAPTGHQRLIDAGGDIPVLYWDAWNARLFCKTYTQRGKNSDQQTLIMGAIRTVAADFQTLFTRGALPYHYMERFREAEDTAMARGYDHTLNMDWSEIRFDLTFSIRTDAW